MKKQFLLGACLLWAGAFTLQAQNSPKDEELFIAVQQAPEFIGGMKELSKFLSTNLEYPELAEQLGIEGKVLLRFANNNENKYHRSAFSIYLLRERLYFVGTTMILVRSSSKTLFIRIAIFLFNLPS